MTTAVNHPINAFLSDLCMELSLQLGDGFIVGEHGNEWGLVDNWTIGYVNIGDGIREDWRAIPRLWMNMTPARAASRLIAELGHKATTPTGAA